MISVRGSGGNSTEGSDLSEEDDPRYKPSHRLKYKTKRSFRLRRRKQQGQLQQQPQQMEKTQPHPPPLGDSLQFSALTSDSDLFSPSCKFPPFLSPSLSLSQPFALVSISTGNFHEIMILLNFPNYWLAFNLLLMHSPSFKNIFLLMYHILLHLKLHLIYF